MVLNNFKSKGLGKGLAALLGESETKEAVIEQNFTSEKVATHLLKPNRFQPRKNFDKKIVNNDILFANPKVQKWLLVAVIRGDGCALQEGYQLTMSNQKLIQQLFEIALRCGLSPYLKEDAKKT